MSLIFLVITCLFATVFFIIGTIIIANSRRCKNDKEDVINYYFIGLFACVFSVLMYMVACWMHIGGFPANLYNLPTGVYQVIYQENGDITSESGIHFILKDFNGKCRYFKHSTFIRRKSIPDSSNDSSWEKKFNYIRVFWKYIGIKGVEPLYLGKSTNND